MKFSHIDEDNRPQMVDITEKSVTIREATAKGTVKIGSKMMQELFEGEIKSKKGPVLATAIIAATMAVKKTHELIPFCHPLILEKIRVEIKPVDAERLEIQCQVACTGKTGVEMEALTGVHIAALTVHDMGKSMNPHITVENILLVNKSGGKNHAENSRT